MKVSLGEMEAGRTGMVVGIDGGRGMTLRLSTLGIRPGARIKKVSCQAMRGPVVVEVGRSQVAIGFGMAKRVLIEIEEEVNR